MTITKHIQTLCKFFSVCLLVEISLYSVSFANTKLHGTKYSMTASYYGNEFHGRKTANGEVFNKNQLTAAHKSLPFHTKLLITYPKSGKSVVVRINDRGPYIKGRDIDLSEKAAIILGMKKTGVANIIVKSIG